MFSNHCTTCSRTDGGSSTSALSTIANNHILKPSRLAHGIANSTLPSSRSRITELSPNSRRTPAASDASTNTTAVVTSPSPAANICFSVGTAAATSKSTGVLNARASPATTEPSIRSTRKTRLSRRKWSKPMMYQKPLRESMPYGSTCRFSPL